MSTSRSAALCAAVAAALCARVLSAQIPSQPGESVDLSQIVVSAARDAQPLEKTGSSVSVIDAAQLQSEQTVFAGDALTQVPGVALLRNGGAGQTTSLFIRGAQPGQAVVLIDGIRINDPAATDGSASLGDLLANDVQRIEVLRGPQSTLYGSDAIGGVIDIQTRRGGPGSVRLSAEAGTFDTYHLNAAADGSTGAVEYGGAVDYLDTGGISAADALRGNTEPDGARNLSATANLRLHAGSGLSVDLRGLYLRSHTGIDGYPPPNYAFTDDAEFGRYQLRAGYAALNFSLLDGAWTQRIALIGSSTDRRFYGLFDPQTAAFTPAENFYADGGASRWEYQGIVTPDPDLTFTYGTETELTTLDTESLPYDAAPTRGHDRLTGSYAQAQWSPVSQLTLTTGMRRDEILHFGHHDSYKVALAWQPAASTVVRANVASGFKAPTLYQLYSQYQNPLQTLAPEGARAAEIGLDQLLGPRVRLSATFFERTERQLIDFFDCFANPTDAGCAAQVPRLGYSPGYYYNVGRSSARGVEADLAARLSRRFSAWINYTRQRSFDERSGLALARRPGVTASGGLAWQPTRAASLGLSLSYLGARYDDAGQTIALAPETVCNVFAGYAITDAVQLTARAENLFKDRKEPVYGYGQPGRAFYAGLRVTL